MKKYLLLVICMVLLSVPAFAADWKYIYKDTYVDVSNIRKDGPYVSIWFKIMSVGKSINNTPVAYDKVNFYVDCAAKKVAIKGGLALSADNRVLSFHREKDNSQLEWNGFTSGTNGETVYKEACSAR